MSCCSSSRNPSLIKPSSLSSLSALPGMASITSESIITGQKQREACKWLQCTHENICIQTHPCLLCLPVGSSQVHANLLSFDTDTAPPHPQHTYSVCVIEAVGWNYKLKVSAGEGRSNYSGFDVLLQQCMWGEWPPCLFSVKTQKVTQCTIRSLFTRQNMRHCHYELTQKYTFEKHAPWRTPGAYHPIHGHPHTDRHVHILGLWHLQTQRRIFHIIILKSAFRLCILHTWTLCDLHTHTHTH